MSNGTTAIQKTNTNFRKLQQVRINKANPRRKLTVEEARRLDRLEAITDKLKRGENEQNRQLQTWLSEDEYETLYRAMRTHYAKHNKLDDAELRERESCSTIS